MAKQQPLTIEAAQRERAQLSESAASLQQEIAGEENFQALSVGFTSGEEQQYHAHRVADLKAKVRAMEARIQELSEFLATNTRNNG